jgi:hypothetical protein
MNDYEYLQQNYQPLLYITHSAKLLNLPQETICVAKALFHKFYAARNIYVFDPYLVGMTSLYLASKIKEDLCKIRDVITTCFRVLHPEVPFLKIGTEYWLLRESVVKCEMILLRTLNFEICFDLPFAYFFNFCISIVSSVVNAEKWIVSVAQLGWMLLNDCFYVRLCTSYSAFEISGGCLFFALEVLNLTSECVITKNEPKFELYTIFDFFSLSESTCKGRLTSC